MRRQLYCNKKNSFDINAARLFGKFEIRLLLHVTLEESAAFYTISQ